MLEIIHDGFFISICFGLAWFGSISLWGKGSSAEDMEEGLVFSWIFAMFALILSAYVADKFDIAWYWGMIGGAVVLVAGPVAYVMYRDRKGEN
jgi:hypothetical protein